MSDVYCEKERTAAKTHKCGECRHTIAKGEQYQYVSGIWEGDPYSFKTCLVCAEIRRDFNKHVDATGYSDDEHYAPFGMLGSYVADRDTQDLAERFWAQRNSKSEVPK